MVVIKNSRWTLLVLSMLCRFVIAAEPDRTPAQLQALPGGTPHPVGHLELRPLGQTSGERDGITCEHGTIVVPEHRRDDTSRPIEVHFFRFLAREPSGQAPVFVLPGGPGGYFDKQRAAALREQFADPDSSAAIFLQHRDVVLMNQRGARAPDRRYQFFGFLIPPGPLDQPFSATDYFESVQAAAGMAIVNWTERGVDVAGYDIMNLVEDLNDVREALGYDQIVLRGTSFGSQWSFAYMQAHPESVERAVLGGTEPIDYGYDSPQGIWRVFQRVEQRLAVANGDDNRLHLPDVTFTDAIQQIVTRLNAAPVEVEITHPRTEATSKVTLGADDFRRQLRSGIAARRESAASLQNLPKFVFEVLQADYRFLAAKVMQERTGFNAASLQALSIDNSLGISAARDRQLDQEAAREWVGELNLAYKATREVTTTPVVPDAFRVLSTDIPVLLVHGDLDLSTPIENAEAAMETLTNAHLLRIIGGTHGAFDHMGAVSTEFRELLKRFLDADFSAGTTVRDLQLPAELSLPALEFRSMDAPPLFETLSPPS